ncbi:diguanylate cyclase [Marinobacteraceae bacterium S3BR75-40.1]
MENRLGSRREASMKFKPVRHFAWVVLESMRDSIIVTNRLGHLCYLNQSAEELLGITFSKSFGHPIQSLLKLEKLNALQPSGTPLRQGGAGDAANTLNPEAFEGFFQLETANREERFIHISTSLIHNEQSPEDNILFTLRSLPEDDPLTRAFAPRSKNHTLTDLARFKRLLESAASRRKSRSTHGLLFIGVRRQQERYGEVVESEHDEVNLQSAIRLIQQHIRDNDHLCRIGNRKLALLLDDCSLPDATRTALKLINAVRSDNTTEVPHSDIKLSLSVCVTPLRAQLETYTAQHLLEVAEEACDEAGRMGNSSLHIHEIQAHSFKKHQEPVELVQ